MAKKQGDNNNELEQQLGELTADLQRVQADFVNYRTRMEEEKARTAQTAKAATILKLLPVVDNIERAIAQVPSDLAGNTWVQGVSSLGKSLEKSLGELGLARITALGQPFDPNLYEAISAEGDGDHEVVSEELRAGYMLDGRVIRHSLVKVAQQQTVETESPERAAEVIQESEAEESANDT